MKRIVIFCAALALPVVACAAEAAGAEGAAAAASDAAAGGTMNIVDAIAIGIVVFSLVLGTVRGLTGEFARICALFAGLFCGYFSTGLWQRLALKFVPSQDSALLRGVFITVGILLTAAGVSALVRWGLKKSLKLLMGQPFDAVLGAVLGAMRGFALFAGLLFLASFALPDSAHEYVFEESFAGKRAAPAVEWAREKVASAREAYAAGRDAAKGAEEDSQTPAQ